MNNPETKGASGTELSPMTVAFGLSVAVTSLVVAVGVIIKEKTPSVMAAMKSMTGHHWISHSLIAILAFVFLGLTIARSRVCDRMSRTAYRLICFVTICVALSSATILGFYLFCD